MRAATNAALPPLSAAFPHDAATLVASAEAIIDSVRKAETVISEAALSPK